MHRLIVLLAMCSSLLGAAGADLKARLELEAGKQKQASASVTVGERMSKRAVLRVKANESVTARWSVRADGEKEWDDVLVHFYVAKEERAGQEQVDLRPARVVMESALTMDFKSKDQVASAFLQFKVSNPGWYLVKIESLNADQTRLDTPSATLDLEVR